jgi:hypothetical protein
LAAAPAAVKVVVVAATMGMVHAIPIGIVILDIIVAMASCAWKITSSIENE